jgi:hypothetical protein
VLANMIVADTRPNKSANMSSTISSSEYSVTDLLFYAFNT